jgi:hypothetical protein
MQSFFIIWRFPFPDVSEPRLEYLLQWQLLHWEVGLLNVVEDFALSFHH